MKNNEKMRRESENKEKERILDLVVLGLQKSCSRYSEIQELCSRYSELQKSRRRYSDQQKLCGRYSVYDG